MTPGPIISGVDEPTSGQRACLAYAGRAVLFSIGWFGDLGRADGGVESTGKQTLARWPEMG